jgi:hypothetical protein
VRVPKLCLLYNGDVNFVGVHVLFEFNMLGA